MPPCPRGALPVCGPEGPAHRRRHRMAAFRDAVHSSPSDDRRPWIAQAEREYPARIFAKSATSNADMRSLIVPTEWRTRRPVTRTTMASAQARGLVVIEEAMSLSFSRTISSMTSGSSGSPTSKSLWIGKTTATTSPIRRSQGCGRPVRQIGEPPQGTLHPRAHARIRRKVIRLATGPDPELVCRLHQTPAEQPIGDHGTDDTGDLDQHGFSHRSRFREKVVLDLPFLATPSVEEGMPPEIFG